MKKSAFLPMFLLAAGYYGAVMGSSSFAATTPTEQAVDIFAKVPSAVKEAALKEIGDNKITEAGPEFQGANTLYEVAFQGKDGGGQYSLLMDETGKVMEREVEIVQAAVPPEVWSAAQASHTDGKIVELNIVFSAAKIFYEFDIKVGTEKHMVKVSAKAKVTGDDVSQKAPTTATKG